MMHWYWAALLTGALTAIVLAWRVPRAVLWVSMGALSFVASSMWHDAGLPYGAAFGAFTNFAVCFALYAYSQQKWEQLIWQCFLLMILVDILYLAEFIDSHYIFAISLELANWLALLVIMVTGIMDRAGHGIRIGHNYRGGMGAVHRALFEERTVPQPFWRE